MHDAPLLFFDSGVGGLSVVAPTLALLPHAPIVYAADSAGFPYGTRSEAEIAKALGDPARLARELRAEIGFKRWESARTPGNFIGALFGFLALIAVDFIFLLPVLAFLLLFTFVTAIGAIGLCIGGAAVILSEFGSGFFSLSTLGEVFTGIALLGFGIGGGALLLWLCGAVVRLLARYARLHYTLLNQADMAA